MATAAQPARMSTQSSFSAAPCEALSACTPDKPFRKSDPDLVGLEDSQSTAAPCYLDAPLAPQSPVRRCLVDCFVTVR